jgi:hypothetical protein
MPRALGQQSIGTESQRKTFPDDNETNVGISVGILINKIKKVLINHRFN